MHKHRMKWMIGALILGMIGVLLFLTAPAKSSEAAVGGATIAVNTTADELNADGDCSLREAIQAANTNSAVDACTAGSGDDTINLPAGTYILALAGANENGNATGDLDVWGNLVINGAGAASTIINGGGIDRVLDSYGSFTVEINGVTITNGGGVFAGGGIYNTIGALTLNNSIVSGNVAQMGAGGGIFNNQGTLTVNNSTVSGNTTDIGGGIYNYGWPGANLTLINSTISGNTAEEGGGIYNWQGTVTLANSTVSGNTVNQAGGGGGGIYSLWGTLT
ncbi:MAG: CSLREA domain-containing protein, partial [Anaerolineae bacterium]